jgi:hypothetical protein
MKTLRSISVILVVALGICLPRAACAELTLFRRMWGDVLVVTDMTEEGRALTPPTLESPVYYMGSSLGCRYGSTVGDRLPDVKKMNLFVADVLAKQGYLYAQPGVHEPSLFLLLQWEYLQPGRDDLIWFLGYDEDDDIAAPAAIGMLGMEIFRRNSRSRVIETILTNMNEPNYGIIITAFKYNAEMTGTPVVCWQTRISLTADAKTMALALPTMVAAAGPAIGRESKSPQLMDSNTALGGHVELGEMEVVGYEDEAPPADEVSKPEK